MLTIDEIKNLSQSLEERATALGMDYTYLMVLRENKAHHNITLRINFTDPDTGDPTHQNKAFNGETFVSVYLQTSTFMYRWELDQQAHDSAQQSDQKGEEDAQSIHPK